MSGQQTLEQKISAYVDLGNSLPEVPLELKKNLNPAFDVLKNKYDQIFLVRNEKHFQLYNFDDGKPIEPDFVLFFRCCPRIKFLPKCLIEL